MNESSKSLWCLRPYFLKVFNRWVPIRTLEDRHLWNRVINRRLKKERKAKK